MHDVNVIRVLVTSQYSKSSQSEETRNRINYLCGPLKHTLS